MFFVIDDTDIASCADDNTPYFRADNIDGNIKSLEEASETLFKWFNDNLGKAMLNSVICQLVQTILSKQKLGILIK